MAAYVILVVLAAFGGLCALWALFGFLLPHHGSGVVICYCKEDDEVELLIRRHLWLYNAGLLKCPLLLVDEGLSSLAKQQLTRYDHPIILCTAEELHTLLIQERIHFG